MEKGLNVAGSAFEWPMPGLSAPAQGLHQGPVCSNAGSRGHWWAQVLGPALMARGTPYGIPTGAGSILEQQTNLRQK